MKYIYVKIRIFIVAFTLVGAASCELEENNPNGMTPETVYATPVGFETLVSAAYFNQRAFYGKMDAIIMTEAGTDLWVKTGKPASGWQEFTYQGLSGMNGNMTRNFWRGLWPAINICNSGINRIKDVSYTNETTRNQKEGELRFLRAFYYYHVVETYGGVMLRTTETKEAELYAKRSTVKDFYDLMIADLEFAANNLPSTNYYDGKPPADYNRACRKSATGLFAKVLLTRAYYALDENNTAEANTYFERARDMAHDVITNASTYGVSLYADYADLWKNKKGGNNKNSRESLYTISFSSNTNYNYDAGGNKLHNFFLNSYAVSSPGLMQDLEYGRSGSGYFMPTKYLLLLFNAGDARYKGSFQDVWKCNLVNKTQQPIDTIWTSAYIKSFGKDLSLQNTKIKNGDTAFYITPYPVADKRLRRYWVVDQDSMFDGENLRNNDVFPVLKKFLDPNRSDASAEAGTNDIIVMRLAEMYLIAAEAEIQLGQYAEAVADINVLRRRASIAKTNDLDISTADISPKDKGIDFILDERARELAGEHMRWYDLKRTRRLVSQIESKNKDISIPASLKMKDNGVFENVLLRPIPQQTELDKLLNADEFKQNPGY